MIVGAPHTERVRVFEPQHDSVSVVHAHRVAASKLTCDRVQPVPYA